MLLFIGKTTVAEDNMDVRVCLDFVQNCVGCVYTAVAATLGDIVISKASQCSTIVAHRVLALQFLRKLFGIWA